MDRFPEVDKGDAPPAHLRSVAWGVRGETRDGIPFMAIHSDRFDDVVYPRHHAVPVRSLLAEGGYTVPGKDGRGVRQIKVQGVWLTGEALLRLRAARSVAGAGALIGRQGARRISYSCETEPRPKDRGFVLGHAVHAETGFCKVSASGDWGAFGAVPHLRKYQQAARKTNARDRLPFGIQAWNASCDAAPLKCCSIGLPSPAAACPPPHAWRAGAFVRRWRAAPR